MIKWDSFRMSPLREKRGTEEREIHTPGSMPLNLCPWILDSVLRPCTDLDSGSGLQHLVASSLYSGGTTYLDSGSGLQHLVAISLYSGGTTYLDSGSGLQHLVASSLYSEGSGGPPTWTLDLVSSTWWPAPCTRGG